MLVRAHAVYAKAFALHPNPPPTQCGVRGSDACRLLVVLAQQDFVSRLQLVAVGGAALIDGDFH